ncbi:unnamed protein product, partial [Staurois parvus]
MGPCTASSCCCQARNLPWAPVPTPHAAARPVICHGPLLSLVGIFRSFRCSFSCYSSSRIPSAVFLGIRFQETTVCEHAPDGAETERPPVQVAAARLVICHAPLYRLLMLLPGPECVMGPRTDSKCCCQARNLSWAPVPPPHAAA